MPGFYLPCAAMKKQQHLPGSRFPKDQPGRFYTRCLHFFKTKVHVLSPSGKVVRHGVSVFTI